MSDHADRIDHFSTLWRFACSTGKVLFTGRPNFFLDDEELKNALRVSESRASGAYCQALRIQPFSPEQMSIALRWMGPKREEFMKAVEGQSELLVLIRKPSFLFQVSRLWHLGLLKIDGGAVYSANVILDFISYSLDRQIDKQMGDVAQGPQTARFIPLRRSELEYFLCGCAIAALSSGRNNSLSAADFRGVIASLVELAPESWFGLTTHDDGSVSMTLSERMPDLDKRIESCAHAVRTHGVLEIDSARADHYKFSHKSFAEALVANAIVSAGIKDQRPITVLWRPLGTLQVMGQRVVFSFVRDISILVNSQEKLGESEVFFNLGVGSTKLLSKLSWINSRILTEIIEGPTGIVRRLRSFIRVGDAKRLEQESAYVAAISFGGSNLGQEVLINLTKGFVWAVLPMFLIVAWSIYDWFLSEAGSGFLVRVNLLPALIGVALGAFGQYFSYSYLRSRSVTFFLPAFYSRLIARPTLFAETSQRPETEAMGLSRKSHRLFIDSVIEAGLALGLLHSERRGEVQVDSSI
ncbi:hypothetical protein [Reyranella sp.]|uniref:hypothetical protein n=1 Tax=Reyranella sp. TaxID=1929291 RepID=UPI003F70F216